MKPSTYLLVLLSAVLWFGCGKDDGPTTSEQIQAFIDTGWKQFNAANYTAARTEFGDALNLDSTSAGAQVGYAWSLMRIPGSDMQTLLSIITSDSTDALELRTNGWTVMSAANLVLRQYPPTDSLALLVLNADTSYVFSIGDPDVDWRDVLLLRGQALYFMSYYDSAWVVVQPLVIGTEYDAIDNTDPTTWSITVGAATTTYTIFAEVLSIVLGALIEDYR